ncbi:MAG: dihydroorotate dehydrogenase (quinone) [Chloroflexi bacterium]|nr:dihydroorotate dehydrogenase (quinone) [Chloroflexota bacterium]
MYPLFRPILFKLDPETAHSLTLDLVRLAGVFPPSRWLLHGLFSTPPRPVSVFGLAFRNPVGLAAGYDKDGVASRGLAALGFGHLEIGTVTPRPQPGNPKPRVFRLVEDAALINRMGFPGRGAEKVAVSLRGALKGRRPRSVPVASDLRAGEGIASPGLDSSLRGYSTFARIDTIIGVNLGKNKDTPLENAAEDYLALMRIFAPLADYLAINVSSPNTVGLRRLQGREMLENLLGAIADERRRMDRRPPILVKLAPDLSDPELDDALGAILDKGMDGVIAANTTLAREGLRSPHRVESGGLSGHPLTVRSEAALKRALSRLDGRLPVVSAGGIMSPEDAKRRLDKGAALVQVYTGLVYAGPGLVRRIVKSL